MRCLLDSNILIRLAQPSDPLHKSMRRAVRRLRQQGASLYVLPQNLAEFWNVCTRPATARGGYGMSVAETNRKLSAILRRCALLEEAPGITAHWRRLIVRYGIIGASVHDARLVAAMQVHGLTHILTIDTPDFARYPGITAIDPATV